MVLNSIPFFVGDPPIATKIKENYYCQQYFLVFISALCPDLKFSNQNLGMKSIFNSKIYDWNSISTTQSSFRLQNLAIKSIFHEELSLFLLRLVLKSTPKRVNFHSSFKRVASSFKRVARNQTSFYQDREEGVGLCGWRQEQVSAPMSSAGSWYNHMSMYVMRSRYYVSLWSRSQSL